MTVRGRIAVVEDVIRIREKQLERLKTECGIIERAIAGMEEQQGKDKIYLEKLRSRVKGSEKEEAT